MGPYAKDGECLRKAGNVGFVAISKEEVSTWGKGLS